MSELSRNKSYSMQELSRLVELTLERLKQTDREVIECEHKIFSLEKRIEQLEAEARGEKRK
jgi:hypothetical protein